MVLWLLGAVSCGDESDPNAGSPTLQDGVPTVRHSARALANAPALGLREVVRIGSLDGPRATQFFQVVDAVLEGGEYYVLDRGHAEVRVFGPDGEWRRSFGGEGDGPGELREPHLVRMKGDTVVVGGRRVTLLDRQGTVLGTGRGFLMSEDLGLGQTLPSGSAWVGMWYSRPPRDAPTNTPLRDVVTLQAVDPRTGEPGDSLFAFETPEYRKAPRHGFILRPFFQGNGSVEAGPDGKIYFAPAGRYEIEVRDSRSGRFVRRIVADADPVPVTDDLVRRAIERERARVADAPAGSETEKYADVVDLRAELPVPEFRPVVGRLISSRGGWLAAQRLDLDPDPVEPGDPASWDVFDPEGALRGRVVLPDRMRILELLDDGVLVVERDELDVDSFVHYRFEGLR